MSGFIKMYYNLYKYPALAKEDKDMSEVRSTKGYDTSPMTVGDWLITMILLGIPLVGLVMLLYWSLSSTGNLNRRNYCLATLVIVAVVLLLFIIFALFGGLAMLMSHQGA